MNDPDNITITLDRYHELIRNEEWLGYLEAAGIDNTDAYEIAQEQADEDGFYD